MMRVSYFENLITVSFCILVALTAHSQTTNICDGNLLADGGFELGPNGGAWTEWSLNFSTPVCSSGCGSANGLQAYEGDYWVWFGGTYPEEDGYVLQTINIPSATTAQLSFYLAIPVADKAGFLRVSIDSTIVFQVTEADAASYATYQQIVLDISSYADGANHEIMFEGYNEYHESNVIHILVDAVCLTVESATEGEGEGEVIEGEGEPIEGEGEVIEGEGEPIEGEGEVIEGEGEVVEGEGEIIEGEGETLLPVAYFEASTTFGAAPLTVTFTNLSENADDSYWEFGNGDYSFEWELDYTFTAGGIYPVYLEVSNDNGWDYYELWIEVTGTPFNDECANAALLYTDYILPGTSVGSTGTDINGCGSADTNDVWFYWTAPFTGTAYISLCYYTDFDTTLSVYDACGGTEIICNDDYCGTASEVNFEATEGSTYFIRVSGYANGTGYFQLYASGEPIVIEGEGEPMEGEPMEGEGEPTEGEGEYVETICEGNLLWEGGFEQGTESTVWAQFSTNFNSPLCIESVCGLGNGTGPYEGEWWAWFGGTADDEEGFLSQSVAIPESSTAFLSFYLEIPVVGNPGYLLCGIDDDFLFLVSDTEAADYEAYSQVILDVSAYADGQQHEVFFYSNIPAGENPTNFFVDAVCLTLDTIVSPPPNDLCDNAATLLTDTPMTGTNMGADGDLVSSCSYSDTRDVWYQWTPEQSGTAVISLCNSTDFDTTLAVFDGCSGTELACNDDYCDLVSELTLEATTDTTYLIRVAGYDGETGTFTLTASFGGTTEGEPTEGEGEPVDLQGRYRGDANLDNIIDFDDVEYALDIAIQVVTPEDPLSLVTADVDRDGSVTSEDALEILLFVKGGGLITEVPEGIRAESGGNQVTVFWEAVPHVNLGGYALYRKAEGESDFVKIGTTTNTSFTDLNVETLRYTYYVVTLDVFGNEGAPSDESSVLANTVRVWLPEVWAMAGEQARIPINFGNARGLTPKSMIFNIRFDPTVMTFNKVDRAVLAKDVEFIDTVDATTGLLRIISIDPTASIIGGEGRFLDLLFDVKEGTSGNCVDIGLERATLADTADKVIATELASGQLCVGDESMWGDVNANGDVEDTDAQTILDIVTRKIEMTPYHKKVGDLNGDGRLDSADAVVVLRLAKDEPINPPATVSLTYSNETLAVTIPDQTAGQNDQVTLPLSLSNVQDVAGMDIVVSWPPDELGLDSVALASTFNGSQLSQTSGNGFVRISFSGEDTEKAAGEAVVADLVFDVLGDVTTSLNPAPVVRVNHTDVKQAYGESHLWFGDIELSSAKITIVEGSVEGEKEGESDGEGETPLTEVAQSVLNQFANSDTNGDGKLDFTEAQTGLASLTQTQFDTLDLDHDGFITEDELNTTLGIEPGGCCRCEGDGDSGDPEKMIRKFMADWLLVGLSMLILLSMSSIKRNDD